MTTELAAHVLHALVGVVLLSACGAPSAPTAGLTPKAPVAGATVSTAPSAPSAPVSASASAQRPRSLPPGRIALTADGQLPSDLGCGVGEGGSGRGEGLPPEKPCVDEFDSEGPVLRGAHVVVGLSAPKRATSNKWSTGFSRLTPDQQVLTLSLPAFGACVEESLSASPAYAGVVQLKIRVGADGVATEVAESTKLYDHATPKDSPEHAANVSAITHASQCIREHVRQLPFPEAGATTHEIHLAGSKVGFGR